MCTGIVGVRFKRLIMDDTETHLLMPHSIALNECAGIVGVRFKRLIMDDTGLMPKNRGPRPEKEESYK